MRKKSFIKIKLKSDMCVSSGYAYAGVVDTDVCYDRCGFPTIPAKRLKGVLRKAAETIGVEDKTINALFGKGGAGFSDDVVSALYVDDASIVIDNLEEIKREILGKNDEILSTQSVLSLFTDVKAQTKLEESGVAKDNSLRFIRTVNHYMPECIDTKQSEIEFEAPIEYDGDIEDVLSKIVKAVRHIGMNRNRGLGNVICELNPNGKEIQDVKLDTQGQEGKKVVIEYSLKNVGPLMLSSSKDNISDKYISGQVILGTLANMYLRIKKISEPDDVFNDLFLSGKNVFNNLYVTDDENRLYCPAPLFVNRLKKTKKIVCVAKSESDINLDDKEKYDMNDGNQPKKMVGKYTNISGNKILVKEPNVEMIYHHSKSAQSVYDSGRKGDDSDSGILYSMQVLEAGQRFSGTIIVEEKYADIIRSLLTTTTLRLGKSRTAEYGKCVCDEIISTGKVYEKEVVSLSEKEKVFVVFESDAIIPSEYGYSTDYAVVEDYISSKIGLKKVKNARVYMNTKTVVGYNAKMNLKKASVPSIAAGSVFEFEVEISGDYQADYIGAFNSEGYGKLHIVKESELNFALEEIEDSNDTRDEITNTVLKNMYEYIGRRQRLEQLKVAFDEKSNIDISASLVGRITLMLKESQNQKKDDVLQNFANRVDSIKRDGEKKKIVKKLKEWKVCDISSDNPINMVEGDDSNMWSEYLFFILTHIKYSKTSEKKNRKGEDR